MKLFFALILLATASSALASGTPRPGANNGSLIEQPAQKPLNNNQVQEEQDFRTDEQIRLDQARREKANARRLKEERLRRLQRSNTQATIVP